MKSYARIHGEPNENDKGYVSISYSKYATKLYSTKSDTYVYRLSLLCAFIFLIILTPVALAKLVFSYYPKIVVESSKGDSLDARTGQHLLSLSSVILHTLLFQLGITFFKINQQLHSVLSITAV